MRWSLKPQAQAKQVSKVELEKLGGPNYLEAEIDARVSEAPLRWTMEVTIAGPDDPTSDPTQAWPADRRTVDVGTLLVRKIAPEAIGPCRDINFDPAILPKGVGVSDDPFPAARSAAYARSYAARILEADQNPHTPAGSAAK